MGQIVAETDSGEVLEFPGEVGGGEPGEVRYLLQCDRIVKMRGDVLGSFLQGLLCRAGLLTFQCNRLCILKKKQKIDRKQMSQ